MEKTVENDMRITLYTSRHLYVSKYECMYVLNRAYVRTYVCRCACCM